MREFFFTLLGFIVADTADHVLGGSVDLSASDFYFIDAMLVADKLDYCLSGPLFPYAKSPPRL